MPSGIHKNNHNGTPEERFWKSVNKGTTNECWEWQKSKNQKGYGQISIKGKLIRTHRYSYELHYGPIPKGICVCHTCDNPPCVNPTHLWLGTIKDNAKDMVKKGRRYAPNNRKYTKEEAKERDKERSKNYGKKNKKKIKIRKQEYHQKNRKKELKRMKEYHQKNKEKIRKRMKDRYNKLKQIG